MIWVGLAGLAAVVGAWYLPVTVDEAWSLVVARRMNRGDRLYRDVFYGAAPLAIVVQALAFRLLRPQGVVVRLLTVGYLIAEASAAAVLVGAGATAAVVGVMVACGGFHLAPHNHYGHLTAAATLWAGVAVSHDRPLLAGVVVGLGVLGRYPVGVLATVALGVVTGFATGPMSALALVAVASLPAIVVAGFRPSSVRWFFERAVANKPAYLATGGANPLAWLRSRAWSRWRAVAMQLPVVAAMALVVIGPVVAASRLLGDHSDDASLALALTVVGASIVFPRFDAAHAVAATPLAGSGLVLSLPDGPWVTLVAVAGWLLAAVAIVARVSLTARSRHRRDVPSLRYLPVRPLRGGVWPDRTEGLPRDVFVLRKDAAFVYACGGLTNPTPFDYPAASTFGSKGQSMMIDRFRAGMPVCHGWFDRTDPLTPLDLVAALPESAGHPTALGRLIVSTGAIERS